MPEVNAGEMVILGISDMIALAMVGPVADTVAGAIGGNVTGPSAIILGLIKLVYVSVIVGLNVAVLYKAFKTGGD